MIRQIKIKYVLVAIVLAICVIIYFCSVLSKQEVRLQALGETTVELGVKQINCELVNPSFHSIKYGNTFYLEFLSTSGWKSINDGGNSINFELGAEVLKPFSSAEIEFYISAYSNMEQYGLYRIVFPVQIGKNATDLYFRFTVE